MPKASKRSKSNNKERSSKKEKEVTQTKESTKERKSKVESETKRKTKEVREEPVSNLKYLTQKLLKSLLNVKDVKLLVIQFWKNLMNC